jgi:hypothetical protein
MSQGSSKVASAEGCGRPADAAFLANSFEPGQIFVATVPEDPRTWPVEITSCDPGDAAKARRTQGREVSSSRRVSDQRGGLGASRRWEGRTEVIPGQREGNGGTMSVVTNDDAKAKPIRILLANEPLTYREVLAYAFKTLRPEAEVRVAGQEDLDQEVRRFRPHMVVCNRATPEVKEITMSWVELYPDGEPVAMICTMGQLSTIVDVHLDNLIFIIDQTAELIDHNDEAQTA